MKVREYKYYACDFETTVFDGQDYTEVWSACIGELYSDEKPLIFGSIEYFFNYVFSLNNAILYFHNLKFDGSFIVDFLIRQGFKFNRVKEKEMKNGEFKCSISEMGQWYNIIIKYNGHIYEIRDSLKLLPFSLSRIGKSFNTSHKKLEMEYKGYRYKNCPISPEEKKYIINDVYVLKEALEIMFEEGHNAITIGSCCLKEFKGFYDKEDYEMYFPNIYELSLPEGFGEENAGEYVRRSYRGGWCYLNPKYANKIIKGGSTYDVNSLYPSMMHSISGNYYPVGKPRFFKGLKEFEKIKSDDRYLYFVRFKCHFDLREGYLPTVQIKGNFLYKGNEYLYTSDVYHHGEYHRFYTGTDGEVKETIITMTMTQPDFDTFLRHYKVDSFEILDGCYFYKEKGLFDDYINKYRKQKVTSKGARRELAKLYLNNLYGKEAASTDSSYKVPYLNKDKDCLSFDLVEEHEKQPGYIPIGSYITSYARNFTIKYAQANYDNFIYADTDSIHLVGDVVKGIRIHSSNFCCWKRESIWDKGVFVRQKTYIERITFSDIPCKPRMDIKCAGMPEKCKRNFKNNYLMEDFHIGLSLQGKLRPKRMKGGLVLVDTTYEMK